MTKVIDVLQTALELIHKKGWHQGSSMGPNGSLCSLGALGKAISMNGYWGDDAIEFFAGHNDMQVSHIATWNDDPHRTFEDVELAFKRAIEAEALRDES